MRVSSADQPRISPEPPRNQPPNGTSGMPCPAPGTTSSEPASGCGAASRPDAGRGDVEVASGPGRRRRRRWTRGPGSSITRSSSPSRGVAAHRGAVPQGHPHAAVGVDGQAVGEAGALLDLRERTAAGRPRRPPSTSKTSMRRVGRVDVVHEAAVGAPAGAVADRHVVEDTVGRAVAGRSGTGCRRRAPRRSAWCPPTGSRRGRRPRRCRGGRGRARGAASGRRRPAS